jgi:FkbM family methyltransferase
MRPAMDSLQSRFGLLRSELIYFWKPFSRRRLRLFYRPFVRPGDLCFDIGAHVGNRSRALLDNGARVMAVEPQPACAACLRRRFGRHPRFTLIPKAVGARAGISVLHINRLNPTISTLSPASWRAAMARAAAGRERWDRQIPVNVITLDQLIEQYGLPHFCKIDVEGFEDQVLAGLSYPLRALSFEFISFEKARASACLRRLQSLGAYRFNWSLGERRRLEAPEWVDVAGIEHMLRALGSRIVAGDVYARLSSG